MKVNVLVVDDEIVQIESLRRGLKSKGFQVSEASNADKALEKIKDAENQISLVITDYAMPGKNGMELLQEIRETDGSLPVIMMTAYGEKDLVIEALRNNCDSFIEKPFTLDQLMQEIERVLIRLSEKTRPPNIPEIVPRFVHQINNPLMAITAGAQLAMLQLNDQAAIEERIEGIIKATEKIRWINKEILRLGQTANDDFETVDLEVLLEDCACMFDDMLTLKKVLLEKDIIPDLHLWGNKFSLEQLFKNLLLNATDSMKDSRLKILRIKAGYDRDSSSILVSIEDTGCGIPEESMDKIFVPYFTNKEKGSGLGLYIVKSIVEKHNGSITIDSQVGKGTTFNMLLPTSTSEHGI